MDKKLFNHVKERFNYIISSLKTNNIIKNIEEINIDKLTEEFILNNNKYHNDLLYFLYKKGYISKEIYLKLLSSKVNNYNVKILNIERADEINIDPDILEKIPFKILKEDLIIPLTKDDDENTLKVIVANIDSINKLNKLNNFLDKIYKFDIYLTTYDEIEDKLEILEEKFYIKKLFNEIEREINTINKQDTTNISSIDKFINYLIEKSIEKKVSDIHIEGKEKIGGIIRFRILGTMVNFTIINNRKIYEALVSRLKIISNLDVSEKLKPQDGAFTKYINNVEFNFRISTLPTVFGESVVIRILDKSNINKKLDDIGISPSNLEKIRIAIKKPNGIFLVTGPTGSGKSTTLYAVINDLDKEKYKIITVEDPVEYKLEDIQQVQVNEKVGLTFASALRSILRQDPDIILIGEIRDKETLEIAIKAALTGHLVISTLHTNDAISAINRMIDMGAEPFLVGSALIGVEAQRLVKTICPHCKTEYTPNEYYLKLAKKYFPKNFKFKKGKGCRFCNFTGYNGRTLISEIFLKDADIEDMIAKEKSKSEILSKLREKGYLTMFEDGIKKVLEEKTTLEEVFRVTSM